MDQSIIGLMGSLYNTPLNIEWSKSVHLFERLQRKIPELNHDQFGNFFSIFGRDDEKEDFEIDKESGIAIIPIKGVLVSGEVGSFGRFLGLESYQLLTLNIEKSLKNSEVNGILLDIDSPGGEAGGMFDLVDYIYQKRSEKPIRAVANDTAFSAAYGIASAAEMIYTSRVSGVGSVGTLTIHTEFSKWEEQKGITSTIIRAGKYKAETNDIEPLTDHAQSELQNEVNRIYEMFVSQVARNRNMSTDQIKDTQALLYYGENGIQENFADRLANFDQALQDFSQSLNRSEPIMVENANQNNSDQETAQQENHMTLPAQQTEHAPVQSISPPAPQQTSTIEFADDHSAATIKDIIQMCTSANRPDLIQSFTDRNLSASEVSKELILALANSQESESIDNTTTPNTSNVEQGGLEMSPVLNDVQIFGMRKQCVQKRSRQLDKSIDQINAHIQ